MFETQKSNIYISSYKGKIFIEISSSEILIISTYRGLKFRDMEVLGVEGKGTRVSFDW